MDDAVGKRQTKSPSAFLGRVARLEDEFEALPVNAVPRVGYFYVNCFVKVSCDY